MKPPPFEYHAPRDLDGALRLLADEEGAVALAGGQTLVQELKFRRTRPRALVDLNGVEGLEALEERDGELQVGALVRQQRLVDDPLVAARWPLLAEAARFVGYAETRRRGTVGGSLAFAAPWAELTAAAVALDAQIDLRSAAGERTVAADSFFRAPFVTALEPGELVVRVRFPTPAAGSGAAFHEVSARYRDYAQVAAAAVVTPDGARLVLLRVADTPFRVEVEDEGAVEEALAATDPPDDVEVSGAYRRRVAAVLARRALRDAADRAREAA